MEVSITKAAQILNSLKMGVIPTTEMKAFAVGRDKYLCEIDRCLELAAEGAGIVKFISGEYGSGKSFILQLTKQEAISKCFITVRLQIDNSFRLNDLSSFYYHLMHNLSIDLNRNSGTSFEEIFDLWVNRLQNLSDREAAGRELNSVINEINSYNSSFGRAVLTYMKAKIRGDAELSNAAASWIKGEKNVPAALKAKLEVKGSIDKENSMDYFKAFNKLIKLLGYSGIVVLIDELELLMNLRSDIRKVSYENLRYIIDSCGSEELMSCMFLFAGTPSFFENEETGARSYQALSQRLGSAIDKRNSSMSDIRQTVMQLSSLNNEDLEKLTDNIIELHKTVYSWQPKTTNQAIKSWTLLALRKPGTALQNVSIREFIVKLIEVLDITEQHPDFSLFNSKLKIVDKSS